ncbi:MAG: 7-carboxy-7-deazaguanine synthase QueE [Paraglaciecola polaris]|nr:7-carboxy-7-deazaguanine synthase QueE [Paraglaciecola polaris]
MNTYKINEVFESLQGEGAHTGVPSIFIRLQGCPVGCPWCDTKHTWTVDENLQVEAAQVMAQNEDTEQWFSHTPQQLLSLFKAQGYTANNIILTGGEPCMYDLTELSTVLLDNGYSVQIETSGTYEILTHGDTWVTVSPKVNMPGKRNVLKSAMLRANEIKHPVAMQKHIDELEDVLLLLEGEGAPKPLIYLQPISQQKRATELCIKTCIARNWRLSLQTHKFIGIE